MFVIERIVFYAIMPLDWSFAYARMQNLDILSLRTDFWGSLQYLHVQPPLFNAFVGAVAISAPERYCPLVVQTGFFALACMTFAFFRKILRASVRSSCIARAGDVAYLVFPTILFAERWFTYTFPVTAMLVSMAFLLLRYSQTKRLGYFFGFSALAGILVLNRSFFHVFVWMVPALVCAFFAGKNKDSARKTAVAVIVLAVSAIPYFRNLAHYGQFTSSTFQGMNFYRTMHYVPRKTIEDGIASKKLHPVCRIGSFAPLEDYLALFPEPDEAGRPMAHHQVLDNLVKSQSATKRDGEVNWNHRIIPIAASELQKGFFRLLLDCPERYAESVLNGVYLFFTVDVYRFWDNSREWLPQHGESFSTMAVKAIRAFAIPLVIATMFILSLAAFIAKISSRLGPVALFCGGTMLYVLGVSVSCELGENSIMRVPVDPFMLFGSLIALDGIVQKPEIGNRFASRQPQWRFIDG